MAKAHSFDPDLAQEYGLEEAVMIHSFQWWIGGNRANGKNSVEGRTWSFNSYQALAELFPYWTPRKVRRVAESLVAQGVLLKGQRKLPEGDPRNWYAFADEARFLGANAPSAEIGRGVPERAEGLPKSAEDAPKSADVYEEQLGTQLGTQLGEGEGALSAAQTFEPDPLFANPAGPPPQGTNPLRKPINDALFVYCDETDRWGWLNQLTETCRRYQEAGRPFRVEQLAVAAMKGRAAWYAEGKTTRPKFLNCFLDALASEISAAEKAARDQEERRREREALKRFSEGRAAVAVQTEQIRALREAAVAAGPDTPEWEACALFLGGGQRLRMSDSLLLKWWQEAQPPPTAAQIAADPILRRAYGRQSRA